MKRFLILILSLISLSLTARDYTDYHKAIIKAEEYIFVHNKIDSGIYLYSKTFSEFDFVYAGDCLIAIQIALFANNEKAFLNFTEKAFQNGLMLRNFKKVYYIKRHAFYLKDTAKFIALYKSNRPHYLARIDTIALKRVHSLFCEDQLVKNGIKLVNGNFESEKVKKKRYLPLIEKTVSELNQIVIKKGLLSDKIVGISQADIMRELKLNMPDMMEYWWRNKKRDDVYILQSQFETEEELLYSPYLIPIILHHPKRYNVYEDRFYIQQIKLGNIHPKDVAGIYDFTFNGYDIEKISNSRCYFGLGAKAENTANDRKAKDSVINECRAKWFIAPIENDRAKWKFMQEHKMNYGLGWAGFRS